MFMAAHGCVVPDSPLTLSALNDISKLLSKCDWAVAIHIITTLWITLTLCFKQYCSSSSNSYLNYFVQIHEYCFDYFFNLSGESGGWKSGGRQSY